MSVRKSRLRLLTGDLPTSRRQAKRYRCPVRLELLKDGRPSEELCFDIQALGIPLGIPLGVKAFLCQADGFMPGEAPPEVEAQFPANLPIQTYASQPHRPCACGSDVRGPCRAMVPLYRPQTR